MFNLKFKDMKRATFNILFFIKWKKLLKTGEAPVYMRITINGDNAEASLKRCINPKLWDTTRNKAKGNSPEAEEVNDYITSIRGQLFNHQKALQESGKLVNPKMLLNAYLGIGVKQWTIVELFQEHNDNMSRLVNKEFSPCTLQKFKTALMHIKNFCQAQYNSNDLQLSEIDNKFISGFEFYLKTTAKCQHNSAMKHIKGLKKIIRIALSNDFIRKDPFSSYKITQKSVERGYLTESELKIISEKVFTIKRIDTVRDLFIFQCYTGLAYKDLENVTADHIQIGIDGHKWIIMKRGKTGVTFRVPILPYAENIIRKYADDPSIKLSGKLLPVPSNQKMNAYLKEIADLCGIKKELHTHLARHTYATTVTLSNGIPMETVSRLLGHTKIQTTQIYAKVLDTKISKDMDALRTKMAM